MSSIDMNSKFLIVLALALSFAYTASGKFLGHHHYDEENQRLKPETEENKNNSHHYHGHHHENHWHHGHHGHHHHHKPQCQGEALVITEEHKKAHRTCWNELKQRISTDGVSNKKKHHRHLHKYSKIDACFIACKFEKLNLVEDGALDMDAVEEFVEITFPEAAREDLTEGMARCNNKLNETLSTENQCKSYMPLARCVWKSIKKTCSLKRQE